MSRARATEVSADWGSVAHVLYGFLAALLHVEYLFTAIFLVKQVGDVLLTGEDWSETSGDIVEYSVGLVVGLVVGRFF